MLAFLWLTSLILFGLSSSDSYQPFLWPLPSEYSVSNSLNLNVDASAFTFSQNSESEIIDGAFSRYKELIFQHTPEGSTGDDSFGTISGLSLNIKDSSEDTLGYGMDESYGLLISKSGGDAILNSNTIWGALRGMETFSQLIVFNTTLNFYQTSVANISDYPRFSHRGILIDTSRHFQSVASIKNVLLSMSFAKFNVLHWHIVDSQAFPFESKSSPKLWDGSYTMYERYIQNDVTEIIHYAKSLGIRVIPEFDMPGHAQSWCIGYPEICPSSTCNTPLNPASNATWDLLTGLIGEVSKLFTDDHIHLGGDEVDTTCWTKTQSIVDWMNMMNYTALEALQYFDEGVIKIANNNGKTVIDWDEIFTNFASTLDPENVIIQVWHGKDSTILPDAVKAGFRGIYSPDPMWYLDHLNETWQDRYIIEPLANITNEAQQNLVIGGECCMWGNYVDVSVMQNTIWPTAASVAERLWSPREVNDTTLAKPRIEYFRCLLNQRGIAAAPTNNAQERSAPSGPGSCYVQ